jgi:hypothetical protein
MNYSYTSSMTRRLGLASLVVVVFALGGAAAGPAKPLQSLRLVASIAWLNASEHVEHEAQPIAPRVAPPSATTVSPAPQSVSLRRFPVERWLFQRPPPASL